MVLQIQVQKKVIHIKNNFTIGWEEKPISHCGEYLSATVWSLVFIEFWCECMPKSAVPANFFDGDQRLTYPRVLEGQHCNPCCLKAIVAIFR